MRIAKEKKMHPWPMHVDAVHKSQQNNKISPLLKIENWMTKIYSMMNENNNS